MKKQTFFNLFYKKPFPVLGVMCSLFILFPVNLSANISGTFVNSLLYKNSGNYLWSTWDFLTNPYIYSLHKKNSVSFNFTNNSTFSAGGSYLFLGYPIYLAFGFNNSASKSVVYEPVYELNNQQRTDNFIEKSDVRVMLGTIVYKNMGLGVYFIRRRNTSKISPVTAQAGGNPLNVKRETESLDSNLGVKGNLAKLSVISIGFEFGQFGGGVDVIGGDKDEGGKFSYSVGMSYNNYGTVVEETVVQGQSEDTTDVGKVFTNDAPFITLGLANEVFEALGGGIYFGRKREEVNLDFLSWYVLAPFSNVGVFLQARYAPKRTGTDGLSNTILAREPTGSSVPTTVDTYRVFGELFVDLDVNLSFGGRKWGVLRLSPAIQASYIIENASFGLPLGGSIKNAQTIARLSIPVKFFFYLNKSQSLTLVAGWRPRFNLTNELLQEVSGIRLIEAKVKNAQPIKYKEEEALFSDGGTLNDIFLGFKYEAFAGLNFHVGFGSANNFYNLNEIEFGIDYYWGGSSESNPKDAEQAAEEE